MRLATHLTLMLFFLAACGGGASTTPDAPPLHLAADQVNFLFFYTDN